MRARELVALWLAVGLGACGDPEEATRVDLTVLVDATGLEPVTTDLGYEVTLDAARLGLGDLLFTVAGEAHTAALWRALTGALVPVAHAHPGHFQAGDVTGELRGRFVADWLDGAGAELGVATLLAGTYQSANFTFVAAGEADGLAVDDPLAGHTALLAGVATRAAETVAFTALIDTPVDRALLGAPFVLRVRAASRERLGLRLLSRDPLEGDTLFDGVDFGAADEDGDGQLLLSAAASGAAATAYTRLARTLQTHDHFDVRPTPPVD